MYVACAIYVGLASFGCGVVFLCAVSCCVCAFVIPLFN